MHNEVNLILQNAKIRFENWLSRYEPWHGDNCITERNLTFQFATAFLGLYPNGLAFMEVPFATTSDGHCRYHLDAYFHTNEFDLLLECKRVYGQTHIQSVVDDIRRMVDGHLVRQIKERHVDKDKKPNRTYGVVLAEAWDQKTADWWRDNDHATTRPRWSKADLPDWHYDFVEVKVWPAKEKNKLTTLFWLYGVSPELTMPLQTLTAKPTAADGQAAAP
ncbi:MAG: hypothetical protein JJE30_08540 [Desulfuromonadales bacterium]|nr:hypothetical protein [Desulfuromonadales bacterium]